MKQDPHSHPEFPPACPPHELSVIIMDALRLETLEFYCVLLVTCLYCIIADTYGCRHMYRIHHSYTCCSREAASSSSWGPGMEEKTGKDASEASTQQSGLEREERQSVSA